MSFFENTRKPVGLGGKIMVAMMNLGHSPVARWGLRFLELTLDAKVLDCGCGGGANIKRLLKKCPEGIVKGIDYSHVSVEKSKKVNEAAIAEGRCTVLQGSVADMIFAGDWFDAVTAFETVYFWPDLPQCFREVYRVLKPGGTLLICNESNGDTDKDKKWTEIIGGMTIYKDAELKTYECYRKMITLYGGGNVSTCGFSSGGALALGIAAHNNAQPEPLPQPRHIVAVSPGEVPWNDAEKARMQALNERDVSIDYAFMVTVEKIMRHGCENVPDYMLSGSRGDFTGVGDIHFFYSADEVLYGALPDFEEACKRANVPYTVSARLKMVHCYCMLPIFKEAKEDFAKIVEILEK